MNLSAFLPLLTYPEPTPTTHFIRALDLAATLGAEVQVAVVEADVRAPDGMLLGLAVEAPGIADEAMAASRRKGAELTAAIGHMAGRIAVPLSIEVTREGLGLAGSALATAARTHDFALLCLGDDQDHRDLAESILFESGGPAILLPDDGPVHLTTVGVAWDNSRAAARALRDALPIMAHADQVVVFSATFDKEVDARSVGQILALLGRHGITARSETVAAPVGSSVAEALQYAALANDCGLLVMGAYGHSRLREFILGGATRSVLDKRKIAVLMSH